MTQRDQSYLIDGQAGPDYSMDSTLQSVPWLVHAMYHMMTTHYSNSDSSYYCGIHETKNRTAENILARSVIKTDFSCISAVSCFSRKSKMIKSSSNWISYFVIYTLEYDNAGTDMMGVNCTTK